MTAANSVLERPLVSVIVPARNEEASLGACLESLLAQTGVSFEVIVVDDASTDRTREIAQSFPSVRVVEAGPLSSGWTGKNNAVTAGARVARGDWLLFTDADTVHKPASLARAVAEAQKHGAALLSYSPEQEVHGFWEKAVMPVIFAELAATYSPSRVSDRASPAAAANGQYILVSRDAYEAVGGHAAIAGSLLEDVALARAVKTSGRKIFFRYGGDAVRARMYRSFAQLREGWTKNLALLFPGPIRLAVLRLVEFLLVLASAGIVVREALAGRPFPEMAAAVVFLLVGASFVTRIGRAHFPARLTAPSLLGLPVFSYLLLCSAISHGRGDIAWKGRTYSLNREAEVAGKSGKGRKLPRASAEMRRS
jgi:glycosyltransferase involved in cell wall biosynthesis